MEINDDETTKSIYSYTSRHNATYPPHRARVTFQLGCDDKDDSDYYDTQADIFSPTRESPVPPDVRETGHFKRRVSNLGHAKDNWKIIKKESLKNVDDKNKDLGSVTKLLKKSSIYAISQVGHADSPYQKILWVLVLLAGILGCCYEIHRFLTLYFQYPVIINLNIENKYGLEFPAVTICNLNRMRKKYEVCLQKNESSKTCKTHHVSGSYNKVAIPERRTVASCSDQLSGISDKHFNDRITFLAQYTLIDATSRQVFGHQLTDFIRNCSFNGEQCSLGYFSYFQSLKYGNCFTFNKFSVEDDTVLKTSTVGVMNGLDIILHFDPDNYLDITSSVGARVIIHDPREDPNPEEEGMNIGPGYETTLAIKQTCIRRLPAPYKDRCIVYGEDGEVKGNNRNDCVKSCMQEINYARCSCIDPTLPLIKHYDNCNMTDLNDTCCLDAVLESMATDGLPCKCPLPCFSTAYDSILSTAIWPSGPNYFNSNCDWCPENDESLQLIRRNQARLKIYYSTLERTTYEQKAMFQDSELFSQLGGQMGLWLGLSIVAAFELIESVIYVCKYCAKAGFCSKNG